MSSGAPSPPPDWAALYAKHKDKMWASGARILREAGRESETEDVVHEALRSLMGSPPSGVQSWEAVLVATVKRRAIDLVRSARVRHDGGETPEDTASEMASDEFLAEDVAEAVDSQRAGALVWEALGELDGRDRQVVWERIVHQRSLRELASEFALSEGRISQITKKALAAIREALNRQGMEGW